MAKNDATLDELLAALRGSPPEVLEALHKGTSDAIREVREREGWRYTSRTEGGPTDTLVQKLAADMIRLLKWGRVPQVPPGGLTYAEIAERYGGYTHERIRRLAEKLCPLEFEATRRPYTRRNGDGGQKAAG